MFGKQPPPRQFSKRHDHRDKKRDEPRTTALPFPVILVGVLVLSFGVVRSIESFGTPSLPDLIGTTAPQPQVTHVANVHRAAVPICSGGNRKARRVTCIVDGDTGWEHGVKWRMLGTDAPEISHPECNREYDLGIRARDRLRELMSGGYKIEWSGDNGYYGRALVKVRLGDGRTAGNVLLQEHLTQRWPNQGNVWCGR